MPKKNNPEEAKKLFSDQGEKIFNQVSKIVINFAKEDSKGLSIQGMEQINDLTAKLMSNMKEGGLTADQIVSSTVQEHLRGFLGQGRRKLRSGRFTIESKKIQSFARSMVCIMDARVKRLAEALNNSTPQADTTSISRQLNQPRRMSKPRKHSQ